MKSENIITNKGDLIDVRLDLYLFMEEDIYIAYSPALDLSGYGVSEKEALDSMSVVIREYISDGISQHTLVKDLRRHGWKVRSFYQRKMSAPSFDSLLNNNETFRDILQNKEYRKVSEPFPEVACR